MATDIETVKEMSRELRGESPFVEYLEDEGFMDELDEARRDWDAKIEKELRRIDPKDRFMIEFGAVSGTGYYYVDYPSYGSSERVYASPRYIYKFFRGLKSGLSEKGVASAIDKDADKGGKMERPPEDRPESRIESFERSLGGRELIEGEFVVKHDFRRSQVQNWTGKYVKNFGDRNQGRLITAKDEKEAKEIFSKKYNYNPFYLSVEPVTSASRKKALKKDPDLSESERMRKGTLKEFNQVLANAGWPAPRRMHTKRTSDMFYSDRGTEVASKHQVFTRGKITSETYMINPDYLKKRMHEAAGCSTPGRRIRSKGKGRGLAIGKGQGPVGVPVGERDFEDELNCLTPGRRLRSGGRGRGLARGRGRGPIGSPLGEDALVWVNRQLKDLDKRYKRGDVTKDMYEKAKRSLLNIKREMQAEGIIVAKTHEIRDIRSALLEGRKVPLASKKVSPTTLESLKKGVTKKTMSAKAQKLYHEMISVRKSDPGYAMQRTGGVMAGEDMVFRIALQLEKGRSVSDGWIKKQADALVKRFDLFPEWYSEPLYEFGKEMLPLVKKLVGKPVKEDVGLDEGFSMAQAQAGIMRKFTSPKAAKAALIKDAKRMTALQFRRYLAGELERAKRGKTATGAFPHKPNSEIISMISNLKQRYDILYDEYHRQGYASDEIEDKMSEVLHRDVRAGKFVAKTVWFNKVAKRAFGRGKHEDVELNEASKREKNWLAVGSKVRFVSNDGVVRRGVVKRGPSMAQGTAGLAIVVADGQQWMPPLHRIESPDRSIRDIQARMKGWRPGHTLENIESLKNKLLG